MSKLVKNVRKFLGAKEEGASMVEYGLLVGLIAVVCIASVVLLGENISALFNEAATKLKG